MKRSASKISASESPARKRRSLRQQTGRIKRLRVRSLCVTCSGIQLGKCETYSESGSSDRILLVKPLLDFFEGMDKGCDGCSFFSQMIQPAARAALQEHEVQALRFNLSIRQCAYGKVEMRIDGTQFERRLEVCRLSSACAENFFSTNELVFREEDEDVDPSQWLDSGGDIACIPRAVSPDVLTEETRRMVSGWLSKCAKHEVCRPATNQSLPTRIIDVSNPKYPRLVETKGAKAEYAILSHCWGAGKDVYKTTLQRLEDHLAGIPLSSLPPTFQDAIAITAHLHYRYLWIDSLCIIQDDRDDWKVEAAKMGPYYKQSALMISASAGNDSAFGFLQSRKALYLPPFGTQSQITLRAELGSGGKIGHLPISKRAWTMQERFLAPRVLHFLRDQMVFECGNDTYSEGHLKNNIDETVSISKTLIQNVLEPELDLQHSRKFWPDTPDWAPYETQSRMRRWYSLIANFSARSITYASDRMLALAGMAREFAHPALGFYLAGLWSEDLFQGLSWNVRTPMSTDAQTDSEYSAPSWSWLSTNTTCGWNGRLWDSAKLPSSTAQIAEYNHWLQNYQPKLVSSHVQSAFGDEFTSVREGSYIEVEGYCRPLFISRTSVTKSADGPNAVVLKSVYFDIPVAGEISFYFKDAPKGSEKAILLQISKSCGHDLFVQALVIRRGEDGRHRRIGTALLENYNLCGFLATKSTPGLCMAVAYQHPRQVDGRKEDMKNKEWGHDRWKKRKIEIF